MDEETYKKIITGNINLSELIRNVIDMNPINYIQSEDKKMLECNPLQCNSHCSCSYKGKETCDNGCNGAIDVNLIQ